MVPSKAPEAFELTVIQRQKVFSVSMAKLITNMDLMGYEVTVGDFRAKKRDPLEHKANSNHYIGCAGDLNLFKGGVYLKETEHHSDFGRYWESLHPNCRWGGRYGDGNHYEVV